MHDQIYNILYCTITVPYSVVYYSSPPLERPPYAKVVFQERWSLIRGEDGLEVSVAIS